MRRNIVISLIKLFQTVQILKILLTILLLARDRKTNKT